MIGSENNTLSDSEAIRLPHTVQMNCRRSAGQFASSAVYWIASNGRLLPPPGQFFVAKIAGTCQVPEPAFRVAIKGVFSTEDVEGFARNFKVKPKWQSPKACTTQVESEVVCHDGLVLIPSCSVECSGESDHEVRDGDGTVLG